jgi:hypothetical protein
MATHQLWFAAAPLVVVSTVTDGLVLFDVGSGVATEMLLELPAGFEAVLLVPTETPLDEPADELPEGFGARVDVTKAPLEEPADELPEGIGVEIVVAVEATLEEPAELPVAVGTDVESVDELADGEADEAVVDCVVDEAVDGGLVIDSVTTIACVESNAGSVEEPIIPTEESRTVDSRSATKDVICIVAD